MTKSILTVLLPALLAVLLAARCLPVSADPTAAFDRSYLQQRVLHFPGKNLLGNLKIERAASKGIVVGAIEKPAAGEIMVQPGCLVWLRGAPCLLNDSSPLSTIAPNSFDCFKAPGTTVDFGTEIGCHKMLALLPRFKDLQAIDLANSDATDSDVAALSPLSRLKALVLANTSCTGQCLKDLQRTKTLESLDLSFLIIDESQLQCLKSLPKLSELFVTRVHIGDKGLEAIAGCPRLTHIDLSQNSRVNDRNIGLLKTLKNLQRIRLSECAVTPAGLLQLKGLPLIEVRMPNKIYKRPEIDHLKSTFPGINLILDGPANVPDFDQSLFAPLH